MGSEDVHIAADAPQIHFVVIPFLAQGHLIPLVDFARLLAQRGALVSLATTPLNANRVRTAMDGAATRSKLPLRLVTLDLPWDAAELPDNFDTLPRADMGQKLMDALPLLADPLKNYILTATPPLPTCIVSDFCHPWTRKVAAELGLPRYVFFSICCFTLHCMHVLPSVYESAGATCKSKPVVVPGIPHRIEVTQDQAPGILNGEEAREKEVAESVAAADGIIVNTFFEMESQFINMYANDTGKKVWPVGPVSLCDADKEEKAARGDKPTIDEVEILAWLDSQRRKSVIYVSLGTMIRPHPLQLKELGAALEASRRPFLWVMRPRNDQKADIDAWLAGGFSDRIKARGLIVLGWVPQVLILSHPSIGAFLTHCGWNSSMEAITAGVPTITWPGFADQFLNERFHVEVIRTGVPVGVKNRVDWFDKSVQVKPEQVEEAVRKVMDEDEQADARRRRAAEIAEHAKKAMDAGGSSYVKLTALMADALQRTRKTTYLLGINSR